MYKYILLCRECLPNFYAYVDRNSPLPTCTCALMVQFSPVSSHHSVSKSRDSFLEQISPDENLGVLHMNHRRKRSFRLKGEFCTFYARNSSSTVSCVVWLGSRWKNPGRTVGIYQANCLSREWCDHFFLYRVRL